MMLQGLHHLFSRKKSGGFPKRWTRFIDLTIYIIAIVAPLSYAPQVYKLYVGQDASGLAIWTFITLFFINVAWLVYGWAHRSMPLVITSILFCAFHVAIVTGIVLF